MELANFNKWLARVAQTSTQILHIEPSISRSIYLHPALCPSVISWRGCFAPGRFSCWDQIKNGNGSQWEMSIAASRPIFTSACVWEKTTVIACSQPALCVCICEIKIVCVFACVCVWDSCFSLCPLSPQPNTPPHPQHSHTQSPSILCKGHISTPPGHSRVSKQTHFIQTLQGRVYGDGDTPKKVHTCTHNTRLGL